MDKLLEYKRSWIQHVNRMPQDSLPSVMKYYSPSGRKKHGRPLKRLLDTLRPERVNKWPSYKNCAMYGRQETCKHGFGGETEGKRPLGRPRYRWENNSKMDHQEGGWRGMNCINRAQDRDIWQVLVNMVMNERVQPIEGNC